jgi:hypothetical protein
VVLSQAISLSKHRITHDFNTTRVVKNTIGSRV